MNEDVRTVQAAIYRCQNERAVEVDPEKKEALVQEEQLLRQRLRDLKKVRPKPDGKTRPWLILMDMQQGKIAAQPFYPKVVYLPEVVLVEMISILSAAAATVSFLRELGLRGNLEMTRGLAQQKLRQALDLPSLRVVSKSELMVMAKRGEVQVRITSDEEDRLLMERVQNALRRDDDQEVEGEGRDPVGQRSDPVRLRASHSRHRGEDHREESQAV